MDSVSAGMGAGETPAIRWEQARRLRYDGGRRDACDTMGAGETPALRWEQARRLRYDGSRRDACATRWEQARRLRYEDEGADYGGEG